MWTNQMLKSNAKQFFMKNYWPCVGVALVLQFLGNSNAGSVVNLNFEFEHVQAEYTGMGAAEHFPNIGILLVAGMLVLIVAVIAVLFTVFIANVVIVGGNRFFIKNRTETPAAGLLFWGFNNGCYKNIVKTMFFAELYIFLWSFLLIIPGIVKAYEYMMVPFILAENPAMDKDDVLALSKKMMTGEKWDAFVLGLSFFVWYLLSAVTCGIVGIFYVSPYAKATFTELYIYNRGKAYQEGYIH